METIPGFHFYIMKVITAPEKFEEYPKIYTIFLAGSIEQGSAVNWQDIVIDTLKYFDNIRVLNPRRTHWDSTWEQTLDNSKFVEQVNWELKGCCIADVVLMYFDPNTKSPISLLELGNLANGSNYGQYQIVCCPDGFWRKGNVELFCKFYDLKFTHTLPEFLDKVMELVGWHVK